MPSGSCSRINSERSRALPTTEIASDMSRDRSGKRAQVGAVEPEEIESHIAGAPRAAEKLVTGRGEYCGDTAPPRVVNTRHDKLLKSLKWKRPITEVMVNHA